MRYYEFVHNLGIHSWDIPALIVAVILVVMILVHHRNGSEDPGNPRRDGRKPAGNGSR